MNNWVNELNKGLQLAEKRFNESEDKRSEDEFVSGITLHSYEGGQLQVILNANNRMPESGKQAFGWDHTIAITNNGVKNPIEISDLLDKINPSDITNLTIKGEISIDSPSGENTERTFTASYSKEEARYHGTDSKSTRNWAKPNPGESGYRELVRLLKENPHVSYEVQVQERLTQTTTVVKKRSEGPAYQSINIEVARCSKEVSEFVMEEHRKRIIGLIGSTPIKFMPITYETYTPSSPDSAKLAKSGKGPGTQTQNLTTHYYKPVL